VTSTSQALWELVIGGPTATAAVDALAGVAGGLSDGGELVRLVIGVELWVLADWPEDEQPTRKTTHIQMIIVRTADMLEPPVAPGELAIGRKSRAPDATRA
jgi:hypothetical protein